MVSPRQTRDRQTKRDVQDRQTKRDFQDRQKDVLQGKKTHTHSTRPCDGAYARTETTTLNGPNQHIPVPASISAPSPAAYKAPPEPEATFPEKEVVPVSETVELSASMPAPVYKEHRCSV